MKMKIQAYLYAPGLLQFIGGVNPIVVTGVFKKEISAKEKLELKYKSILTHSGIELRVRKIEDGETFICEGHLPSVSVHFFKKLKKAGWKIKKEAATIYGFPCNKQDKKLKQDIKKHQEENERYLEAQRSLSKTFKKSQRTLSRQLSKKLLPFEQFPQVH